MGKSRDRPTRSAKLGVARGGKTNSKFTSAVTTVSTILALVMVVGMFGGMGNVSAGNGGGSAVQKPGETPQETPDETPNETPEEIPEETPGDVELVEPTGYFAFSETEKAYPLFLSIEESVGFMEYYGSDEITFTFIPQSHPAMSQEVKIVSSKNNGTVNVEMLIKDEQYGGEYQFIRLDDNYDDYAFYFSNFSTGDHEHEISIALVGIKDGVKTVICENMFTIFPGAVTQPPFKFHLIELPEGYYIFNNK